MKSRSHYLHRSGRVPWLRAGLLGVALVLALALVACGDKKAETGPAAQESPAATGSGRVAAQALIPVDAAKLLVDQAGLYAVSAEQLQAVGFDLQAHPLGQLSLSVAGQPVPFVVSGDGAGADFTFYGEPRQSRYGRENVYWLQWAASDQAAGEAGSRAVSPPAGQPQEAFTDHFRLEEQVDYLSQVNENTDHWLWQSIFAPDSFAVGFDLPGWAGGDVTLDVSLWASTEGPEDPDHHAILRVNGQVVADETWDGKGWKTVTATVPATSLKAEANELVVDSPGDTEAVVDVVYLDAVEVTFPRLYQAQGDRLAFAADGNQAVAVGGFDADDLILWDVTEPATAQPLTGFQVTDGTLAFQDSAADSPRAYQASSREARLAPLAVKPAAGQDLRQNPDGADYIAVVYPDFQEALQPLLDWRRSQGMRVTAASIQDLYDTFSYGMPDPAAIRDYMVYARDHWPAPAPRFLLLVGDASYDYQGFVPNSTPNFVPTYLLSTHFVGETASDNWFVSLNAEDDKPDMAVGRIPAQSAAQVAAVVAKTLDYERDSAPAEWAGKALFVADDKEPTFQSISDDLAAHYLPSGYEVEKVYLGRAEDPEADILANLQQGVGLVTYVGHGSMNVWAQEKIFQTGDVQQLRNSTALPFMMTMTCLVGYFHHPLATSMGEELLFKPDGGIVAGLVPTSESLASDQRELAANVYTHLFGDAPTVGEAIMLGKQDMSLDRDIRQDLIESFVLLGDPALVLHRPN